MPIEVHCDSCKRKLRVPDTAAGKRIKCPKCQGVISVPGTAGGGSSLSGSSSSVTGGSAARPGPSASSPSKSAPRGLTPKQAAQQSAAEQWYVQTEEGEQYGPVSRTELNQWYREGRITAETQLLLEGAPQWQWAPDVFPELNAAAQQPQQPQSPFPAAPQPAANDPAAIFAAMGGQQPAATPAPDLFGGAAAPQPSAADPFNFGASPTASSGSHSSVTSRGKGKGKRGGRGGKKGGSQQIDFIAIALYVLAGLAVLTGLGLMLGGASFAAAVGTNNAEGAAEAAGVVGTVFFGFGLFFLVLAGAYAFVGYGLQQRAGWARIVALILGGLSILNFPVGTAIGIWIFMVLLDKDNAAAFR